MLQKRNKFNPDNSELTQECHWRTFGILAMFKDNKIKGGKHLKWRIANRGIFGTHHKLDPVDQGCGTVFKLQIKKEFQPNDKI